MSEIRQIITISIIGLGSLTSGTLFAWPTQAIPELIGSTTITLEECSYFTVFPPVALILASPIFAYVMDNMGRKRTLVITALFQVLSLGFVAIGGSIAMFYIARIFSGISEAGYYTVITVYMAEITTPNVRGSWGNLLVFFRYFGNLMSMVLVYNMDIPVSAYVFSVIPLLLLILMIAIPDSPYFHLMHKNYQDVATSLRWFRGGNNASEELHQLKQDVQRQLTESSIKYLFLIRSNRKALLIGAFVRGAQQFSGMTAVSLYAHFVFSDGGGNISAIEATLIFIGLVMVCNLGAGAMLDKMRRKRAMVVSCGGCSLILFLESIYFYMRFEVDLEMNYVLKWLPIVGMSLYGLFYSIGMGILPSLMLGELFSSSVKGKCVCDMIIVLGTIQAICTKIFQMLLAHFGLFAAFDFFLHCVVWSMQ